MKRHDQGTYEFLRHHKKFPHLWCAGCGIGIVMGSLVRSVQKLELNQDDVAIVAVVGERMKGTVGIAARLFGALGGAGINILTVAQGSSEHNISLVIAGSDVDTAVRAVHDTFALGG